MIGRWLAGHLALYRTVIKLHQRRRLSRGGLLNGSVPYRPQTISATTILATNHIGHNHIGHTKRPYRPKRITISATKIVLLFYRQRLSVVSLSIRLETLYSFPSHISRELKNFTAINIFQSAFFTFKFTIRTTRNRDVSSR